MIKRDNLKDFKDFFNMAPYDVESSYYGLCYIFGGERIGPCVWSKQYIKNCCSNVEEINYKYLLIEDCDGKSLVVFLPMNEIIKLTDELYNEIINDFELEIKKVNERFKLEKINDDF